MKPSSSSTRIEPLEARIAPASIFVTNLLDSGQGSLRQAILAANAHPGSDAILFSIAAEVGSTIKLLSHLPAITDQVVIDGLSANRGLISIDGRMAVEAGGANNGSGLMLSGQGSSSSIIKGLAIYGFDLAGIEIVGSSNNTIVSNNLGLTASEALVTKTMSAGISIDGGLGNKIGGTGTGTGNVIGGNEVGIRVTGNASNTAIAGNQIGVGLRNPLTAFPNDIGILVQNAVGTQIGALNAGNTISGNETFGIKLSKGATNTGIHLNVIGLDATGTKHVGRQEWGVFVDGPSRTFIGEGQYLPANGRSFGNVISGNAVGGIWLSGGTLESTVAIAGNRIGTTSNGGSIPLTANSTISSGNGGPGIFVSQSFVANVSVDGNLISGQAGAAIEIHGQGSSSKSTITRNVIGTDASLTKVHGNSTGIVLDGVNGMTIGGSAGSGLGNTIVASAGDGILIKNSTNVSVLGNYIGDTWSSQGLSNLGNGGHGIHLAGVGTVNIGIQGQSVRGNTIVSNAGDGIYFEGGAASTRSYTANLNIEGNFVGTDGLLEKGNGGAGIHIEDLAGKGFARIGAGGSGPSMDRTGEGNVISGNLSDGILIERSSRVIMGANYVGTNVYGTTAIGNHGNGIAVIDSNANYISNISTYGIISGNLGNGVAIIGQTRTAAMNVVEGMLIGVGIDGRHLGNQLHGILVDGTASHTGIGDSDSNVIGANGGDGIRIGANARGGYVCYNAIGYMPSELGGDNLPSGNVGSGIVIMGQDFDIGNNTIVSNGGSGIVIQGNPTEHYGGNRIVANRIGYIDDLDVPRTNGEDGIRIDGAKGTLIGDRSSVHFEWGNTVVSETGVALRLIGAAGSEIYLNDFISLEGPAAVVLEGGTRETELAENLVQSTFGAAVLIEDGSDNRIVWNDIIGRTSGVTILSGANNHILQNRFTVGDGGLFVDLGGDGVTPNDPLDADSGPNDLQNSPLFLSAASIGGQTLLRGEYRGAANVDVWLEWYVNGEFLQTSDVQTDDHGVARVALDLNETFEPGTKFWVSATRAANTSEFSNAVMPVVPPEVVAWGAKRGQAPRVELRDATTGEVLLTKLAFGKSYRGGVSVAAGDVDGDGFVDLMATPRSGAPVVKVFSGLDGHEISRFRVGGGSDLSIRSLAAGDLDGDGTIEVVIGRANVMGGRLSVYDALSGSVESTFTPFGFNTPDTLRVSLLDLDGDERPEIVVSAEILAGTKRVVIDPLSGQIERLARAQVA